MESGPRKQVGAHKPRLPAERRAPTTWEGLGRDALEGVVRPAHRACNRRGSRTRGWGLGAGRGPRDDLMDGSSEQGISLAGTARSKKPGGAGVTTDGQDDDWFGGDDHPFGTTVRDFLERRFWTVRFPRGAKGLFGRLVLGKAAKAQNGGEEEAKDTNHGPIVPIEWLRVGDGRFAFEYPLVGARHQDAEVKRSAE